MFRRTHIRLTILNSFVFFILISMLGVFLYSYLQTRLYKDVDETIIRAMERVQYGEAGERIAPPRDPRLFVIAWNEQGKIIDPNANTTLFQQNELTIYPQQLNELYDIQIDHLYFRTMAVSIDTAFGKITVQILRNINSEKEILNRLLLLMIAGGGVALLCSVAAGYFLAERALVPIKSAWQKQQQFVSDASHELRTPLAVIQAKTDLLFRSPSATIEEKIVDISVIAKECRRLSKLVANLLTLARSDSNQIEMKKEPFRIDELLREIVNHYDEIASYQQKEMTLDSEPSLLFAGDRERIHQLIVILLDNAMKYTKEGGKIHLSCHQSASSIILKVQDNGIGIAEEDIPKIFDRFYQSDKARAASDGAGLGLSIAKWIIDQHYGKVKVKSKLGEGTCLEITFPKNQKI